MTPSRKRLILFGTLVVGYCLVNLFVPPVHGLEGEPTSLALALWELAEWLFAAATSLIFPAVRSLSLALYLILLMGAVLSVGKRWGFAIALFVLLAPIPLAAVSYGLLADRFDVVILDLWEPLAIASYQFGIVASALIAVVLARMSGLRLDRPYSRKRTLREARPAMLGSE